VHRFIIALAFVCSPKSAASNLNIAVAANFSQPAKALKLAYGKRGHDTIRLSIASTGKLYLQIVNGAPFDVFLSADAEHIQKLEDKSLTVVGSRFTYAVGQLVLLSKSSAISHLSFSRVFKNTEKLTIAIPNPAIAPYGKAAVQVMKAIEPQSAFAGKTVYGDNVTQTRQFLSVGAVDFAFVSSSHTSGVAPQYRLAIPRHSYSPIRQQAVILKRSKNSEVARSFMAFLKSAEARKIIEGFGYLSSPQKSKKK